MVLMLVAMKAVSMACWWDDQMVDLLVCAWAALKVVQWAECSANLSAVQSVCCVAARKVWSWVGPMAVSWVAQKAWMSVGMTDAQLAVMKVLNQADPWVCCLADLTDVNSIVLKVR